MTGVATAALPGAERVLILADSGGGNSCRDRMWKSRPQEHLVDRPGLSVTVCRYPSGASEWSPVEHRLFGPIGTDRAGEPLRCLAAVLG